MKPATLLLALLLTACGDKTPPTEGNDGAFQGGGPTNETAEAAQEVNGVQEIRVTVTNEGYRPDRIQLKPGVPARLIFHREVEGECAEAVQIPDLGVEKTALPLKQDHPVEFTPTEAGEYTFACGMDMLKGTLLVRAE